MHFFKYLFIGTILLACFYSKPVFSHKLNAAETTINFNDRAKTIEIVHRFYLHDVNHLVQQHYSKHKKAKDEEHYNVFVQYILNNLELKFKRADNSFYKISNIGSESEKKHFFIYQEISLEQEKLSEVSVSIKSMQNQWLPNYWLFSIEVPGLDDDFVLEKSILEKTVTVENNQSK